MRATRRYTTRRITPTEILLPENPYRKLITDLMERGVQVELCGATAKAHGWGNADVIPGIKINTDAMSRLTQLVQEGFIKISES